MDSQSVIYLGHMPKQPLMCLSGDLGDGLEPHDYIYSWRPTRAAVLTTPGSSWEGVPGVEQVGTRRVGIPGTTQPV